MSAGQRFPHKLLVVAGFPRTGTTSIYYNFDRHPSFLTSRHKELNFFCGTGPLLVRDYERLFGSGVDGRIRVDASPFYSLAPEVPERIKEFAPDAFVLLALRPPEQWIRSIYHQISKRTAIAFEDFLANPVLEGYGAAVSFTPGARVYEESVRRFARVFGKRLMILDFRSFVSDPLAALNAIEDFCGTPRYFDAKTADTGKNNVSEPRGTLFRWISTAASKPLAMRLLSRLPRSLIRRAQKIAYGKSAVKNDVSVATGACLPLPPDLLTAEADFYAALFRERSFVTGTEFLERAELGIYGSQTAKPNPVLP